MSEPGNSNCLQDIRIVLLGGKYCGKGETVNTILGCTAIDTEDEIVGNTVRHGEVAGRWRVTLVKTPGWWKSFHPDETMELVKMSLIQSVSLCTPGPHAFLLVVDLDSILEEKSGRSIERHMELLGDAVWNHTLVLLKYGVWGRHTPLLEITWKKEGRFCAGLWRNAVEEATYSTTIIIVQEHR